MIWLVVILISPLYFILRKKWGAFILNAILYILFLCTFLIFGIGFIFWAIGVGHAAWHLRKEVMKEHANMIADAIVAKTKAAESKA